MKHRKLIAFTGAAIIASSMSLLAGAPAAFAAADPAVTSFTFSITVPSECTANVTLYEKRDSNGAFVDVHLNSDPCGMGIEGGIAGPGFTPVCWGGDVHNMGDNSGTCHMPVNSGNHHGLRAWDGGINNWTTPLWKD